jgi:hypothetical protein
MTRNALAHVGSYVVIIAGLLVPAVGHAQSDYSPAKNNCSTPTGCANYATGDTTSQNPANKNTRNSPYDNQYSPAKNNCDTPTGCASYATGQQTRATPARSRAQENRITAELNQQQLAGRNSQ